MSSNNQQTILFPDILSSLKKSGRSLEKCNANLSFCSHTLNLHTREVPRINQALKNSQFFELVSVSEIRAAQYQLTSELEPQIKELVKMTENGLVKLQKREQMLRVNISKRKRLMMDDDEDLNEEQQPQEEEEEEQYSDNQATIDRKLEQQETLLQRLRSQKNSLLKELEKLDLELSRKSGRT
ncbi:hypothetical protein PGT21_027952 [Puccinia graminis f. sp. tritici]|uniref:DASH complex subunit SPC19 n=2 Tax=Puccinia graminis f. sp. tritici TaxID=56615 RepID=E3K0R8_PUCGT|nr:uncharacterized protein PGTG_03849 [Puccinia graminis f. sp. tritici CRL 75-36-700-3]EFP77893.2 hypothetical protein PGTG_03849 [Puccinia graminis f. sp. tritici CRL 75-36-700-3]KAA1108871.1 hypothetical protein PGT21_027952 [Puccinia graminis f. sp. tritici]KAA1122387.1 hypothetical protein PGTUg99_037306 [Puccinia graminis f. sp. tritici]